MCVVAEGGGDRAGNGVEPGGSYQRCGLSPVAAEDGCGDEYCVWTGARAEQVVEPGVVVEAVLDHELRAGEGVADSGAGFERVMGLGGPDWDCGDRCAGASSRARLA